MAQDIFFGVCLIILSIIAVPNLFTSKKGNISGFIEKTLPFQGWIGLIFGILGIIGFIQCILSITSTVAIFWITSVACSGVQTILGFLLSYGLIYKYFLSKRKDTADDLEKLRTKMMPLQGKIGILGIVLGIWSIVAAILFK